MADRRPAGFVRGGSPAPGYFMERGRSPLSSGRGSTSSSHAGSPAPGDKPGGKGGIHLTIQQLAGRWAGHRHMAYVQDECKMNPQSDKLEKKISSVVCLVEIQPMA